MGLTFAALAAWMGWIWQNSGDAAGAGIVILIVILQIVFGVVGFGIWLWALIDCVKVQNDSEYKAGSKVIWLLVIVLVPCGAIAYLIFGRPAR